jgi:FkbM family methyltransferase
MTLQDFLNAHLDNLPNIGIGYSYPGQVEETERSFLADYLCQIPTPVVIDVGANIGSYARTVKQLSPSAQVFAFEPHPESFRTLNEVARIGGIQTFQYAIGDEEGDMELFDLADGSESTLASLHKSVIEQLHHKPSRAFKVQVKRLDALIQELKIPHISLLKVDTEGHELSVFRSALESIRANKIDAIQFEFNEMNVISRTFFKDFFDLLNNYLLIRLTPHGGMPIQVYSPSLHEVFSLQTIVGFRRDLVGAAQS